LAGAIVAIIIVASNTHLNSNSDNKSGQKNQPHKDSRRSRAPRRRSTSCRAGDTLTSIAHKTGLTVAEIQALNPEVDPQILIAGETLKLQK